MRTCAWAPNGHDADAVYVIRLARPCGHQMFNELTVPSCAEHIARLRADPVAPRATPCPVCRVMGPLTVGEIRTAS